LPKCKTWASTTGTSSPEISWSSAKDTKTNTKSSISAFHSNTRLFPAKISQELLNTPHLKSNESSSTIQFLLQEELTTRTMFTA
jgi:BRCT domain type II-containing protein